MRYAAAIMLIGAALASAEEVPIYYDYVEDGQLRGGRFTIDTNDPVDRATFGLDAPVERGTWDVTTIYDNGPTGNRVDIVLLGDGYTIAELGAYANHVSNVLDQFFPEEPLAAYFPFFNVHRVDVISNESGVDEPDNGIYRDTALDMTYNCSGIPRLLCINVSKAANAAASAPAMDQILALANSTRYGGAGYPWANLGTLAGNNGSAVEVALHEFGHSFADLADEYTYGGPETYTGGEPSETNVSIYEAATMAAQQRKWYRWLDLPNVNTYEGAMYSVYGIYRPTVNSKMRALDRPFEEVNVEQFVLNIYKAVSPIDDATPASAEPLSACSDFFVTPLVPVDHALDVQWLIDGTAVAGATGTSFTPDAGGLTPGLHDVSVTVVDKTTRVRDEGARSAWMTDSRQWQISVLPTGDGCTSDPPMPEGNSGCDDDGQCTNTSKCVNGTCYVPKNRYLSIAPAPLNSGALTARRVSIGSVAQSLCTCNPDCDGNGVWQTPDIACMENCLGQPPSTPGCENADVNCDGVIDGADYDIADPLNPDTPFGCRFLGGTTDQCCFPTLVLGWVGAPDGANVSRIVGAPSYLDWALAGVVHLGDCAVAPGHTYRIQSIEISQNIADEGSYSAPLELPTCDVWGDVGGATIDDITLAPDGEANFGDVLIVVKGYQNAPTAPITWLDLIEQAPDLAVGFADILAAVQGFQGLPYPNDDPCTCVGLPACP